MLRGLVERTVSGLDRSPAVVGLGGVAVTLVLVQATAAVPAELLGPDLLLAVAGFAVTFALLGGADPAGRLRLAGFYGGQLRLRAPLLVVGSAVVVGLVAAAGTARQAAQAAADAVAGVAGAGNWWELVGLAPRFEPLLAGHGLAGDWYAERPGLVDPLGTIWLIGLLVQLTLAWPLLLAALRGLAGAGRRPRRLVPLLAVLALAAAAVGPLRAAAGASQAELGFGTHVRLAEWLLGATVAAHVLARRAGRRRAPAGRAATALAVAALLGSATLATLHPEQWLRWGGPAVAALGAALLLLAVHTPSDGGPARVLGRGLPRELGRVAYPLLLVHLPVFWLVQVAVPGARPFALLAVGGALSWLLALVVQDGLVRRAVGRRPLATMAAVLLVAVGLGLGGLELHRAGQRPAGSGPLVLVLGGAQAGDLAATLAGSGHYTVLDGSRPGCGLLPAAAPPAPARTSTHGQLPAVAPVCGEWPRLWAEQIAAAAPAAIVVDLATDAAAHTDPCDVGFRARYRPLLDAATAVWTGGAPDRPVLLVDGPSTTRAGRCLDALLAETIAARAAVVPLEVQALLCPGGERSGRAGACDGSGGVPLDPERREAMARVVEQALAAELGPRRVAARGVERTNDCDGVGDAGLGDAGC